MNDTTEQPVEVETTSLEDSAKIFYGTDDAEQESTEAAAEVELTETDTSDTKPEADEEETSRSGGAAEVVG